MKLAKSHFVCILLASFAIIKADPQYEIPLIVKNQHSENNYNPRIDNLNKPSIDKYQIYLRNKLRGSLHSEMVRDFSIESFGNWITFYESENLNEKPINDIVEDVGVILGKSIEIQNFVNFKTQNLLKKLQLLDIKLKQIEVLDKASISIEVHPGDINTNSAENSLWKANHERLIETTESVSSLFNLNFDRLCSILHVTKDELKNGVVDPKGITPPFKDNIKDNINKIPPANKIQIPRNVPTRNEKSLREGLKKLEESKYSDRPVTKFRFKSKGKKKSSHLKKKTESETVTETKK